MPSRRPPVPPKTQNDIFIRSRRRCCLCVFLLRDLTVKQAQIAHIDHNPANNDPNNLVLLCMPHHDEYDTKRRLSKNLTDMEVKHYRDELYKIVEQEDAQLIFPKSGELEKGTASARLLGQVLAAYDADAARKANGLALAHLAQVAVNEEGEFDVAQEAFISLLRLATKHHVDNYGTTGIERGKATPTATPFTSALKILDLFSQTDHLLLTSTLQRAKRYAFLGDNAFAEFHDYTGVPDQSFSSVIRILGAFCRSTNIEYARQSTSRELILMLLGLGMVVVEQGINIPAPPARIYRSIDGLREVEDDIDNHLLPFVQLANEIASLPDNIFESAMAQHFRYRVRIDMYVDEEKGLDREEIKRGIKRWVAFPADAVAVIAIVRNLEIHKEAQTLLRQYQSKGEVVAEQVRIFLLAERALEHPVQ